MLTAASAPRPLLAERSTEEIDVVTSDCVEEMDEALAIIHDGFVEAGYTLARPSGRRMHASYLNPGTVFFVARIDGLPVGTCALIADGPFGLPSDRAFAEENDLMREESGLLLRECGSLSVRSEARRHTRRIVMRIIAAMTRLALEEFPAAPVPMAVSPESRRFYAAMVGAAEVAGPRPLYRAPAVLLRTGGTLLAAHCAQRETPSQRTMDDLITEPNPSWLTRRRARGPLPARWLQELLDEQDVTRRLSSQLELLGERHPLALTAAVRRAGVTMAA